MSENLNINGYSCENKTVYETLKAAGLTSANLKTLDKNSDMKISEDELVEFEGEEEANSKEETYSDNPTIQSLQRQYKKEMQAMYDYQHKIMELRQLKNEVKTSLASVPEDSDSRGTLEARMDKIQGKIDSANSSITKCLSNMAEINNSIIQAQYNLNNANNLTGSLSGTAGTAGTSGATGGNLNVQSGSGTALASVTGDLSTCLDRVAKSLGTSRQEAADYITTLCNTIGKGYFDPKIILSQVFSESSGNQSCSTTATSKYVGLGQMSAVAVKEVNNQFGTNFSFNDMNDPAKNLQAMVYLMRYQYERYGKNLGAALTAYNVGHYSGSVNKYAQKIMSRV